MCGSRTFPQSERTRLRPREGPEFSCRERLPYANLVSNGFFVLYEPSTRERFTFFAASVSRQQWGVALRELGHRQVCFELVPALSEQLQPLPVMIPAFWWERDGVQVFKVRMQVVTLTPSQAVFRPGDTKEVTRPPRVKRTAHLGESTSESDFAADRGEEVCKEADSSDDGALSLCSSIDSDIAAAEGVVEDPEFAAKSGDRPPDNNSSGGESDEIVVRAPRAPRGTHTHWSSAYFTLVDNRNYPEMRCLVKTQFATDSILGCKEVSKTLTVHLFDRCREEPDEVILALRAWMVQKMRRPSFMEKKCRENCYIAEVDRLRRDVAAHAVLQARTRECLVEWAPEVM